MNAVHQNAEVVATKLITEENFNGRELHTHARKGDRGQVLHREEVDGVELLTVQFEGSGTVATVFPGDNVSVLHKVRNPRTASTF